MGRFIFLLIIIFVTNFYKRQFFSPAICRFASSHKRSSIVRWKNNLSSFVAIVFYIFGSDTSPFGVVIAMVT